MESFFGTLETERLSRYRLAAREDARRVVFEYREVFYNRIRRHDNIGNQSPADWAKPFNESERQLAASCINLPGH